MRHTTHPGIAQEDATFPSEADDLYKNKLIEYII